ncbi:MULTISPECIES: hypothetical protein [Burkholderia]|uniref:hypothetical protein n=1 Tax=Burkholderia TaxID=32008 RepID=UPI0015D49754|nr:MULTISPECIES: hypothetical protein [Burkholderia]
MHGVEEGPPSVDAPPAFGQAVPFESPPATDAASAGNRLMKWSDHHGQEALCPSRIDRRIETLDCAGLLLAEQGRYALPHFHRLRIQPFRRFDIRDQTEIGFLRI